MTVRLAFVTFLAVVVIGPVQGAPHDIQATITAHGLDNNAPQATDGTPHGGHSHSHMHDRGHLSHHHHHAHDISQELGIWQHLPKIFRADQQGGVPLALKVAAAVLLCGEAIVGMMVPLLVSHMHTHQWWMGLLNAFSGGVFLAAGLMHLIPHCQEAQQAVDLSRWGLPAEYPLYLLLVSLGYLLVLMVERVVFERSKEADHSCTQAEQFVSVGKCETISIEHLRVTWCTSQGHSHGGHSHSHDHERAHVHSPLKHHSSDSEESNHSSGHTLSGHPRPRDGSAVPRRKRRAKADAEASAAGADGIAAGTTSCTEPGDLAASAGSCASPLDQGPETPVLLGGKDAHLAHPAPTFRPLAGLTLLTGMTVHTALECLALGIITNHASFMALLVAIASHKAISALALSARFVREGASTHQVLAYVGPFCLVPPLSIAFGMWAGQLAPGVHLVLSCFAAGTFLYVGCSEVSGTASLVTADDWGCSQRVQYCIALLLLLPLLLMLLPLLPLLLPLLLLLPLQVLAEEFEGDVRCGRRLLYMSMRVVSSSRIGKRLRQCDNEPTSPPYLEGNATARPFGLTACYLLGPRPAQPSPAQPSPAQPSPAQPSPAQPSPAQPSPAQPSPAQPSPAQPSPAQPSPAQPSPAQPSPAQPSPAQPSPAQPSPAQPSPAQPSPAQPSPAQPSPAQPSPAQPSPAQPSPAQPSPEGWEGVGRLNEVGPRHDGWRERSGVDNEGWTAWLAPRSSQEATPAAASEPGPSTPPPAKRSKRTNAEQAAKPTQPTKGKCKDQGKAARAKPAPQPGGWLDRDCNAAWNMQHIGESRWRPLELCSWPNQAALPAKGKEYPGLGYKRLRDKPPKAQEQQQPAVAQ
ncbi:hypothetical protein QJQ45_008045 [Haematococcus lacustris]|nr:hypothetical protein QJQ45_008045 [Haematococcus lacustris]